MSDIKGYRELSNQDKANINAFKEMENQIGLAVTEMRKVDSFDKRWISIGVTDLQKGFMALIRAIAQPESELK